MRSWRRPAAGWPGRARSVSRQKIEKAVQRLERAGHDRGIVWMKRSLWVLAGIGAAAAGVYALPAYAWLLTALSSLSIGVSTVVTRDGGSNEVAYLQYLRSTFTTAPLACGYVYA
jgi:hypothetical protein